MSVLLNIIFSGKGGGGEVVVFVYILVVFRVLLLGSDYIVLLEYASVGA